MAPFLVHHQALLNQWMTVRETALARVLALEEITQENANDIQHYLNRAIVYTSEWRVDDDVQSDRISLLEKDLSTLSLWIAQDWWQKSRPLEYLMEQAQASLSFEAVEMLVSIILEPFGDLIDELADNLIVQENFSIPAKLTIADLNAKMEEHYSWCFNINTNERSQSALFWYTSEAKLEPRLGYRYEEDGADQEMPFDIPRQINAVKKDISEVDDNLTLAELMMAKPQHRLIIKRIMTTAKYPYGEIKDNLVAETTRPIDMLRCKLSFFGASKFDPKSILWTRITLYQGAPLAEELNVENADKWLFPSVRAN